MIDAPLHASQPRFPARSCDVTKSGTLNPQPSTLKPSTVKKMHHKLESGHTHCLLSHAHTVFSLSLSLSSHCLLSLSHCLHTVFSLSLTVFTLSSLSHTNTGSRYQDQELVLDGQFADHTQVLAHTTPRSSSRAHPGHRLEHTQVLAHTTPRFSSAWPCRALLIFVC